MISRKSAEGTRTLEIKKVQCFDLKNVGLMGDPNDPFVLMLFETYSVKTSTRPNAGSNICWDELKICHEFQKISLSSNSIAFEVYDENATFANTLIGTSSILLSLIADKKLETEFDFELALLDKKSKVTGKLKVYCTWFDESAVYRQITQLQAEIESIKGMIQPSTSTDRTRGKLKFESGSTASSTPFSSLKSDEKDLEQATTGTMPWCACCGWFVC